MRTSIVTQMAIAKFLELERAKHRIDKKEMELCDLVIGIPNEDMAEYVRVTENIIEQVNGGIRV